MRCPLDTVKIGTRVAIIGALPDFFGWPLWPPSWFFKVTSSDTFGIKGRNLTLRMFFLLMASGCFTQGLGIRKEQYCGDQAQNMIVLWYPSSRNMAQKTKIGCNEGIVKWLSNIIMLLSKRRGSGRIICLWPQKAFTSLVFCIDFMYEIPVTVLFIRTITLLSSWPTCSFFALCSPPSPLPRSKSPIYRDLKLPFQACCTYFLCSLPKVILSCPLPM